MLMGSERYIVKKGRHFLMGCPYDDSSCCRYTPSAYDSWKSKSFNAAIRIAKAIGGKVMKFNPVTGNVSGGWK